MIPWARLAPDGGAGDFGWLLIAVLVWLMPSAEGAEFQMNVVLNYLIAIGGFQHLVAGSMEAFMLVLAGDQPWRRSSLASSCLFYRQRAGRNRLFAVRPTPR